MQIKPVRSLSMTLHHQDVPKPQVSIQGTSEAKKAESEGIERKTEGAIAAASSAERKTREETRQGIGDRSRKTRAARPMRIFPRVADLIRKVATAIERS